MKRFLITILLAVCFVLPVLGQSKRSKTFTSATSDLTLNVTGSALYNHMLSWTGKGTRTSCSVKLEKSVDGTTWTDLIAAQTCTSDGVATASGFVNYVRITVATLTGTGNTLYTTYQGQSLVSFTSLDVPLVQQFQYATTSTASTEITMVAADASAKWNLSEIVCENTSATPTSLKILDTTSGTALAYVVCPATGGSTAMFFSTPVRSTAVNKALIVQPADAVTSLYISLVGFKTPY